MITFNRVGKSEDGKTITLKRLELETMFEGPPYANDPWISANRDKIRTGAVLDVETTGLSHQADQVIEIGIRQFQFNRDTGEILKLGKGFSAFQDPGVTLSEEIKQLTGITDDMLRGQAIDWPEVEQLLSQCQVVIAHNASFDRPFIDARTPVSNEKIWACSIEQMKWGQKGLPSQKLEVLSLYHGFFNDSHRALNDADSLLYLLSLKDQMSGTPYLQELITEARESVAVVFATHAPFETKDTLRARRYRWNAQEKVWSRKVLKKALNEELEWLSAEVYRGAFRGKIEEIQPKDQFKVRGERNGF